MSEDAELDDLSGWEALQDAKNDKESSLDRLVRTHYERIRDMSLETAIAALNEYKHRDVEWSIEREPKGDVFIRPTKKYRCCIDISLEEFEAKAAAFGLMERAYNYHYRREERFNGKFL